MHQRPPLSAGSVNPLRRALEDGLVSSGFNVAYTLLDRHLKPTVELTGHQLHAMALHQAHALCAMPKEPKRVAIVTPSGPEFLVALLGCVFAGIECVAPPFPSPGPTRKRFQRVVDHCRPDLVLAANGDVAELSKTLAAMGGGTLRVEPIRFEPEDPGTPSFDLPERSSGILQYTSGTSGEARAVYVSGDQVVANSRFVHHAWKLRSDDHVLTWLPHHHDMGLFGCLIMPLVNVVKISQFSSFAFLKRPSRWMEAMSATGATFSGGPAFALRMAVDAPGDLNRLNLSHVRGIFCGSEPIPPDLLQRFQNCFAEVGLSSEAPFACYGLAESTLFVAGRPGASPATSCAIIDDDKHCVRIVDPVTLCALEDGEEGEIWVSGPSVSERYLDAPEETGATFGYRIAGQEDQKRTWLRTGDLGKVSGQRLEVSGRIKDMIIASGANIPAFDLELTATESIPLLAGASSAAFAHGALEEGAVALVVEVDRQVAKSLDLADAKQVMRAAVRSAHGVDVRDILFVKRGALPTTTSGKIRRGETKRMYISNEFEGAAYPH